MGTTETVEAAAVTPSLYLGPQLTTIEHVEVNELYSAVALIKMGATVLVGLASLATEIMIELGASEEDAHAAVDRAMHGIH